MAVAPGGLTVAIPRDPADTLVEGEVGLLRRQPGQEIGEGGQNGQPGAPVVPVSGAEQYRFTDKGVRIGSLPDPSQDGLNSPWG